MDGNDSANSLKALNLSRSLPNCPKVSNSDASLSKWTCPNATFISSEFETIHNVIVILCLSSKYIHSLTSLDHSDWFLSHFQHFLPYSAHWKNAYRRTHGQTDGRSDPLIEMHRRIYTLYLLKLHWYCVTYPHQLLFVFRLSPFDCLSLSRWL